MTTRSRQLEYDWFPGAIPANVEMAADAYVDTSYSFAAFHSNRPHGLELGKGSGVYLRASFVVGPNGSVSVGDYTCLNGTYVICHQRVAIGEHCLFAWGVVITDSSLSLSGDRQSRREKLVAASCDHFRSMPAFSRPQPVTIEDNVWVGFDSVVLPGVRLGHGCVIGCKSIVNEDVPPYAVYVGNPGRIVRYLDPDDTPKARKIAFREHLREKPQ